MGRCLNWKIDKLFLTMYLAADQSASAFFRVQFQLSFDNRKKLLLTHKTIKNVNAASLEEHILLLPQAK